MTPLVLCLVLLLTGCVSRSQGFDRMAMQAIIQSPAEPARPGVADSSHGTTQPPRLPFRLALYFLQHALPVERSVRPAEWVSADTERLSERLAPLQREGLLSELFLLIDPTIQGADAGAIRQAAGRYDADAVMVIQGVGGLDRYENSYAALYLTLIGLYFAPGTHSNALFLTTGTLHGVGSEWRMDTGIVEGHADAVGPAMAVEDRQTLTRAKNAALDELGLRLAAQLRQLKP